MSSPEKAKVLCRRLRSNPENLTQLLLNPEAPFTFADYDLTALCQALQQNTHLRVLDLSAGGLTPKQLLTLFPGLESHPRLRLLRLGLNPLLGSEQGARLIARLLSSHEGLRLTELDLSGRAAPVQFSQNITSHIVLSEKSLHILLRGVSQSFSLIRLQLPQSLQAQSTIQSVPSLSLKSLKTDGDSAAPLHQLEKPDSQDSQTGSSSGGSSGSGTSTTAHTDSESHSLPSDSALASSMAGTVEPADSALTHAASELTLAQVLREAKLLSLDGTGEQPHRYRHARPLSPRRIRSLASLGSSVSSSGSGSTGGSSSTGAGAAHHADSRSSEMVALLQESRRLLASNALFQRCLDGRSDLVDANHRHLSSIPRVFLQPDVGQRVVTLNLSHNRLTTLPAELFDCMRNLEALLVSHNRIKLLPVQIGLLSRLKTLDLSSNRLQQLPISIGLLSSLEMLDVSNNGLAKLPYSLGSLPALAHVNVSSNNPRLLIPGANSPARYAQHLKHLNRQMAFCPRMRVTVVGETGSGKSSVLEALVRKSTSKQSRRSTLKNLSLRFSAPVNNLRELPTSHEVVDGVSVREWQLKKVPLNSLTKQLATLSSLGTSGTNVGAIGSSSSGAGSASTGSSSSASTGNTSSASSSSSSSSSGSATEYTALDFVGWELPCSSRYDQTHMFFMGSRSIYLVCFNVLKADEEQSRLEYWLHTICSRARDSPVILVATRHDAKACSHAHLDQVFEDLQERLADRFPNIELFLPINALSISSKSLDELQNRLTTLSLGMIRREKTYPASYRAVEENILARRTLASLLGTSPHMSVDDFHSMAIAAGVPEAQSPRVLTLLHDLSILVHYSQGSVGQLVIYDTLWLTDILQMVMHLKCDGLLTEDELCAHLRPSSRFPKNTHSAILDLLEKFEIAYRLPPSMQRNISTHLMRLLGVRRNGPVKRDSLSRRAKTASLNSTGQLGVPEEQSAVARVMVPCLLRESQPPDLEHFWPRVEPEAMQLGRIFRFVFFPPAFFSVLMARVLHTGWRLRECWRNGMLLTKRTERVLIELLPEVHTMNVAVRGPRSARELPIFLASLEAQIQHGLHVRYRSEVPCIHCLRAGSAEPFLFPLSLLEHAVRRGETVVKCRYVEAVSVYDLAPDIGMLAANSERVLCAEKLQLHERLAGGKTSSVHRATYDGRLVAAKVVNVGSPREFADDGLFRAGSESAEIFQDFRREVWLMSGLRHPNLIQLIGFSLKPMPTLVMEYMSGGSLYERLHADLEPLSEAIRLKIAFDIARAMEFLHSITPPVIHRDLKSPNVLLSFEKEDSPTSQEHTENEDDEDTTVSIEDASRDSVDELRTNRGTSEERRTEASDLALPSLGGKTKSATGDEPGLHRSKRQFMLPILGDLTDPTDLTDEKSSPTAASSPVEARFSSRLAPEDEQEAHSPLIDRRSIEVVSLKRDPSDVATDTPENDDDAPVRKSVSSPSLPEGPMLLQQQTSSSSALRGEPERSKSVRFQGAVTVVRSKSLGHSNQRQSAISPLALLMQRPSTVPKPWEPSKLGPESAIKASGGKAASNANPEAHSTASTKNPEALSAASSKNPEALSAASSRSAHLLSDDDESASDEDEKTLGGSTVEKQAAVENGGSDVPATAQQDVSGAHHGDETSAPVTPKQEAEEQAAEPMVDASALVVAKVGDFGLSGMLLSKEVASARAVDNPIWLAPERIRGASYDAKADVYGFGVILWEMIAQKNFMEETNFNWEIAEAVLAGRRPALPSECVDTEYGRLITDCWAQDPCDRPTFAQIVQRLQAHATARRVQLTPTVEQQRQELQGDGGSELSGDGSLDDASSSAYAGQPSGGSGSWSSEADAPRAFFQLDSASADAWSRAVDGDDVDLVRAAARELTGKLSAARKELELEQAARRRAERLLAYRVLELDKLRAHTAKLERRLEDAQERERRLQARLLTTEDRRAAFRTASSKSKSKSKKSSAASDHPLASRSRSSLGLPHAEGDPVGGDDAGHLHKSQSSATVSTSCGGFASEHLLSRPPGLTLDLGRVRQAGMQPQPRATTVEQVSPQHQASQSHSLTHSESPTQPALEQEPLRRTVVGRPGQLPIEYTVSMTPRGIPKFHSVVRVGNGASDTQVSHLINERMRVFESLMSRSGEQLANDTEAAGAAGGNAEQEEASSTSPQPSPSRVPRLNLSKLGSGSGGGPAAGASVADDPDEPPLLGGGRRTQLSSSLPTSPRDHRLVQERIELHGMQLSNLGGSSGSELMNRMFYGKKAMVELLLEFDE